MKKVLGTMSGFIAAGFSIAVLALLMSLTYGALQRIFPDSFSNQMWGLTMFDIAAMCWALIFVFQSKSVGQYAAAAIGFIVAFLGTLGMVAAEVILSGADLAQVDTAQIGKWMIYGFIGVTAIHALLVYVHHGTAPEIHEQINVGVARGEIVTEAISQATKTLEVQKAQLAQAIHQDIVSQVKRDLGFYPIQNTIFDRQREAELNLEANMPPEEWEELEASLRDKGYLKRSNLPGAKKAGITDRLKQAVSRLKNRPGTRKYEQSVPMVDPSYHPVDLTPKPQEDASAPDAPFPAGE